MQARFVELLHDVRKLVKAKTGLSGAIYTQLVDVEAEVNGLLTYDRKVLIYRVHHLQPHSAQTPSNAHVFSGACHVFFGGDVTRISYMR